MRDALERDGFVAAGRLFDDAAVAAAREATDRLLAVHGAPSEYAVIALESYRREAVFRELLAAVAAPARELLGVEVVVVFQDLVIDKPGGRAGPAGSPSGPGSRETALPWHQDQAYLPLDRGDGLVAWVSFDHADADRGCLRYVPGSHALGARRPADFGAAAPAGDLPPIDPEGRPVVVARAAPGEAWFHDPYTWHSSPPNRTPHRRRAWSIWFVREETRWAPERAPHPYVWELAPRAGAPLDPGRFPRLR